MSATDKQTFNSIVDTILKNWSALKMAIEYGMGTQEQASNFCFYMTEVMFMNESISQSDIALELEDYMDNEFNTVLDDNSQNDVAELILKFHEYFKVGDKDSIDRDLKLIEGYQTPKQKKESNPSLEESSSSKMEIDPDGWQVVSRKK